MELLTVVLEVIVELFGSGLLGLLLDFLFADYREPSERKHHRPIVVVSGYLLLGALIGGGLAWILPRRLLPVTGIPGLSLLLSPLAAGLLMEWWGRRRRAGGHYATNLATWYGGAAFAIGAAAARFLLVR